MTSETEAKSPTKPIQLEDSNEFDATVADRDIVLVDFFAEWCGPCKMMEPTLETVAATTDATVLKVDVDRFQGLAAEYGVRGVPTLALFADGDLVDRMVGVQSESDLEAKISEFAG